MSSSAVGALPDAASLLVDKAGRVIKANQAVAELVRVEDPDDLIGQPVEELLAADENPDTSWLRTDDGEAVLVRAVRWRVPGTGLDAVLLTDLSDLAERTDALRVERRRLTEAQALAKMGWWEFDHQTKKTIWSNSLHKLLGIRPGSVPTNLNSMMSFVHPDDVAAAREAWRRHQHEGAAIDIEARVIRPDGQLRWVHAVASARAAVDRDQPVTGYATDVTDRHRVREALENDRQALLDAQRIARIGSLVYDLKTATVVRSEALSEMYAELGIQPGGDLFSGLAPERLPEVRKLCERFASDDPPKQAVEIEVSTSVGDRTFVVRAKAKTDERGKAVAVQCTLQDVTQQRYLERQLLEDRRRFDDAQRAARLGTWEWDPRKDVMTWSPMLCEMYGVPAGTMATPQMFFGLLHPHDRDWVEEICAKVAQDGQPVEGEYRVVLPSGELRTFRCLGAAGPNWSPDNPVVIGTAQDITEQRTAEARMLRSSQRFADLVALNPVGIGIFDESERLVDANDALCDLLGTGLEKLRGRTAEALTHPDDRDGYPLGRPPSASQSKRTHKVPQRVLVRADGEPVYCELHVAMSVQDDGRRFWLVVFQDITERRRIAETLRHQATHDELTGLPNRAAVNELLHELLGAASAAKVAVLFCDIDNFKRVNDSLGHDAGDELLVALARRLEGGLGEGITVARLSGDEYVIICADLDAAGGVDALATRVSTLLRTAVPVHGQLVRVSASIGAAVPDGSQVSGADLLRFADAAMFEAKKQGPGRVATASAALIASADRQMHLEGQLRDALAADGLAVYFQPVVGPDGAVLTAEALVRWPHPERGMLTPDVFLPVAEQGGLMRELDRWVLRTALREASTWPTPNGRPVAVAVNLAGLAPGDPEFVDIVANAVLESGIEWDRVVLELVETSLVDLPSRTLTAMADLVSRGVRFAVDDFGTGYSSLSRLKDLPVQIIKVDRTFVAGVGSDSSDFAVASAVVDMSRAMGRSCVAEGVENATQFHVLRGMGVDAYQGWLFSRAIPIKAFRELLAVGPLHVPNPG